MQCKMDLRCQAQAESLNYDGASKGILGKPGASMWSTIKLVFCLGWLDG